MRGYADQRLRLPNNPLDPSNRRISLIVQNLDEPSPSDGASVKESAISASPVANIAAKPAAAVTAIGQQFTAVRVQHRVPGVEKRSVLRFDQLDCSIRLSG